MTARVNIEAKAWDDWRFAALARMVGLGRPNDGRSELIEAGLIRCARIWAWQTDNFTPEHPTYVVSRALLDAHLGEGGADAMVRAELAEEVTGGFRICGSQGRIEWHHAFMMRAARAGRASARKRKVDNEEQLDVQQQVERPVEPAVQLQANPPSSDLLLPEEEDHTHEPRARAIVRLPYDPGQAPDRGRLTETTYRRVSDVRLEVARELGLPNVLGFPEITPATRPQGYRDLGDRIREEGRAAPGVCDRVVEALALQARETKSVEWLSEKSFTPGGWRTAREYVPGARARASPRRDHRVGRCEPGTPDDFTGGEHEL